MNHMDKQFVAAEETDPITFDGDVHRDRLLMEIIQSTPIPTFVIDRQHRVTHWNKALERMTGISAAQVVGTTLQWSAFYATPHPCLADLVVDGINENESAEGATRNMDLPGSRQRERHFPMLGEHGLWLSYAAAPLRDGHGRLIGAIETLLDISAMKNAEREVKEWKDNLEQQVAQRTAELTQANQELRMINSKLEEAHNQLLQSEKMASIGQLAAGVAHEINNPVGFVSSNLGTLENYVNNLLQVLDGYETAEAGMALKSEALETVAALKQQCDLEFVKSDIRALLSESKEGLARVKKIVQDLKEFSHVGDSEWQSADLHHGIETTLNIVNNELKYKAQIVKDFGDLPQIQCLPSELNQVFMNILVNAGHAIANKGTITIRTSHEDDFVRVAISDTGCGIAAEHINRIFDPFFTTKAVGKGTGLGLSLSYGIVKKHHGRIDVSSRPGQGTTFTVTLPVQQPEA